MSDQSPPSGTRSPRPDDPVSSHEKRLEVVAVVLLSITALATAWSGYQASLWDGIQSSNYTQASGARTEAAQLRTSAHQFRLGDLSVFENFIDAQIDGRTDVAEFYRSRFRPEFEPAYEAWIALNPLENPDAPPSPLAMPEYVLEQEQESERLEAKADRLFTEGEEANSYSDVYTLTTLVFAGVLFFAAISERFRFDKVRIALLVMSGLVLAAGVVVAFVQPITTG